MFELQYGFVANLKIENIIRKHLARLKIVWILKKKNDIQLCKVSEIVSSVRLRYHTHYGLKTLDKALDKQKKARGKEREKSTLIEKRTKDNYH